MVDPKMLELSVYDGIPHLLTPVVTDPKKAVVALKWAVREMEERYKNMSKLGVRNIEGFNARVAEAAAKGETLRRTVQTGFDPHSGEAVYEQEVMQFSLLPFIVVIIEGRVKIVVTTAAKSGESKTSAVPRQYWRTSASLASYMATIALVWARFGIAAVLVGCALLVSIFALPASVT